MGHHPVCRDGKNVDGIRRLLRKPPSSTVDDLFRPSFQLTTKPEYPPMKKPDRCMTAPARLLSQDSAPESLSPYWREKWKLIP
ncbi:hypothetical protein SACS_0367 [Parasaccharibacter apium]|uniref:Uncharacterized protein n=1 Tax=Parasaccharibacter apium TaxID=1510841 RepID=A0A7U7G4W0_9PROT|nr:hypothetical protein SACS_0367 [Parasaccharibacter apium]